MKSPGLERGTRHTKGAARPQLPTTPGRSANMRANRRRDTAPELRVRRLLHDRGLRYRVDFAVRVASVGLVRPDIAFTRVRLAVFIDGCFWHGCPKHGSKPRSNEHYWLPKLIANSERDRRQTAGLQSSGWAVRRYWEHEDSVAIADDAENCYRELAASSKAP
jgi:DNA mismatch endonuclease (patch repair protein)